LDGGHFGHILLNTLIRWLVTGASYQAAFLHYIACAAGPDEVPSMPSAGVIWRGLVRDVRNWKSRNSQRQSPVAIPTGG
jgi:hypothetical protein